MVTDNGVEMVLSPSYVEEIRNNTKLNFNAYIQQVHGSLLALLVFKISHSPV